MHTYKGTPKIVERWGPFLTGIWADPWKQAPPTLNLVVRRQRMYAEIEGNPKSDSTGAPPPLQWGCAWHYRNVPLHTFVLLTDQTVQELLSKSAWEKNVAPRVPPFKVTQGHQNRHGSIRHLWLSTNVRTTHGPISYHFRGNGDFSWKSIVHPVYLTPRRRDVDSLVIWYRRVYGQEARIIALPDRERSSTISSAVWIQYTNVTDGRTPADSKDSSTP